MNTQYEYNDRVTFASIKAAFGTGGYDDEPPLLEELEISFSDIKKKALVVLYPFRKYDNENMGNPDLVGPLIFCLIFGSILLLRGKVNFGYIYGVASLGSIGVHLILNLMSEAHLEPSNTGSILGYCLLPIVVLSAISTFLNPSGTVAKMCCGICLVWSTITATRMFITSLSMKDQIILVAYPILLLYSCFALMALY
ncbi:Yip1-domain-containing protein [Piromyces finnis]|uniref:Protein YIP n=1 Tax=Piromyces finnis TaxID=1754191 RepID=A0A1Y1V1J4_9FUNG|nr:Yip1-domain-containing protein [Piromyces finnis]|eukprot:ORX45161.1 Yip1-domain-containing protein [Piromyces finnis]